MITSNSYFASDFDYDEYVSSEAVGLSLNRLPTTPITTTAEDSTSHSSRWSSFYSKHTQGLVYKPRKYLYNEFKTYFDRILVDREPGLPVTVLEAGCGYGCSLVPLAQLLCDNGIRDAFLVASDYSEVSLGILRDSSYFTEHTCLSALQWDLTQPLDTSSLPPSCPTPSIVMCIFTLSAVSPEHHMACLQNVAALLHPGGYFLLRDYAFGDLTMFRHKTRLGELLFQRGKERTLAFYFTVDYLRSLVASLGGIFVIEELQMCTVRLCNRRGKEGGKGCADMQRCFVHCVLRKASAE